MFSIHINYVSPYGKKYVSFSDEHFLQYLKRLSFTIDSHLKSLYCNHTIQIKSITTENGKDQSFDCNCKYFCL